MLPSCTTLTRTVTRGNPELHTQDAKTKLTSYNEFFKRVMPKVLKPHKQVPPALQKILSDPHCKGDEYIKFMHLYQDNGEPPITAFLTFLTTLVASHATTDTHETFCTWLQYCLLPNYTHWVDLMTAENRTALDTLHTFTPLQQTWFFQLTTLHYHATHPHHTELWEWIAIMQAFFATLEQLQADLSLDLPPCPFTTPLLLPHALTSLITLLERTPYPAHQLYRLRDLDWQNEIPVALTEHYHFVTAEMALTQPIPTQEILRTNFLRYVGKQGSIITYPAYRALLEAVLSRPLSHTAMTHYLNYLQSFLSQEETWPPAATVWDQLLDTYGENLSAEAMCLTPCQHPTERTWLIFRGQLFNLIQPECTRLRLFIQANPTLGRLASVALHKAIVNFFLSTDDHALLQTLSIDVPALIQLIKALLKQQPVIDLIMAIMGIATPNDPTTDTRILSHKLTHILAHLLAKLQKTPANDLASRTELMRFIDTVTAIRHPFLDPSWIAAYAVTTDTEALKPTTSTSTPTPTLTPTSMSDTQESDTLTASVESTQLNDLHRDYLLAGHKPYPLLQYVGKALTQLPPAPRLEDCIECLKRYPLSPVFTPEDLQYLKTTQPTVTSNTPFHAYPSFVYEKLNQLPCIETLKQEIRYARDNGKSVLILEDNAASAELLYHLLRHEIPIIYTDLSHPQLGSCMISTSQHVLHHTLPDHTHTIYMGLMASIATPTAQYPQETCTLTTIEELPDIRPSLYVAARLRPPKPSWLQRISNTCYHFFHGCWQWITHVFRRSPTNTPPLTPVSPQQQAIVTEARTELQERTRKLAAIHTVLSERWRWLQGAIHSVDSAQTNDQTNPYWEQCKQKIHDSWYPYRGIKPADDTPTIIQYIWHETIRTVSERSPSFQTSVAHDVFIADAKSEMLAHQIRAIIRPDQRFPLSRQPATVPLQQTERVQTILTAQGPKARFLNFWVAGWSTIAQKLAAHSGTFDLTTSNNTELYTFSLCTIFNNPFTLSLNPQDFHYHEYMQQPTFTLAALNRPFQPITQPASPVSSANTSIDTPPSRKKILSTLFTNFSLHLPRTTPSVSDATQAHPNRHNMTAFFETRKKTHRVAPDALPPAPAPSSP